MLVSSGVERQALPYRPRVRNTHGKPGRGRVNWPYRPYILEESSTGAPTGTGMHMRCPGDAQRLQNTYNAAARRQARNTIVKSVTYVTLFTNRYCTLFSQDVKAVPSAS